MMRETILSDDLFLDIRATGQDAIYGAGGQGVSADALGVIPAGMEVNSYFIHF